METQKTPNSQSNLEKENWSWRTQAAWLQTILQSYSNQDSMLLAQKQKYRSLEQDRKPRDKPTHIWSRYLFIYFKNYLFIYFWLCWVFVSVRGLSLVVASGGHSSSRCTGLSLLWPLLLRSTSSRRAGSVIVAHRPSCSAACGILPDQGSNPCPCIGRQTLNHCATREALTIWVLTWVNGFGINWDGEGWRQSGLSGFEGRSGVKIGSLWATGEITWVVG